MGEVGDSMGIKQLAYIWTTQSLPVGFVKENKRVLFAQASHPEYSLIQDIARIHSYDYKLVTAETPTQKYGTWCKVSVMREAIEHRRLPRRGSIPPPSPCPTGMASKLLEHQLGDSHRHGEKNWRSTSTMTVEVKTF